MPGFTGAVDKAFRTKKAVALVPAKSGTPGGLQLHGWRVMYERKADREQDGQWVPYFPDEFVQVAQVSLGKMRSLAVIAPGVATGRLLVASTEYQPTPPPTLNGRDKAELQAIIDGAGCVNPCSVDDLLSGVWAERTAEVLMPNDSDFARETFRALMKDNRFWWCRDHVEEAMAAARAVAK